ncbi:MAG TPA: COR domain-containing protein, partial [Rhodothermales bacterium]|nr:COR domain-containing protein [Rhodothermales bacterium]
TNGVYKILNAHVLFQAHGELERPMLNQILPAVAYPPSKHLFIIDMMRKFELCYDFEGAKDERFLVPDLLPKEEPYTGEWDDSLAFQYHYEILPGSIISRFIVRASQMIHQNTSWRTGVVLANEANRALIKADREDRKIYISVQGPQAGCRRLLERIRTHFEEIHATIPGLTVEPKVPVPGHPDAVVDYEHLLNLEELGETHFIPEGMKERVSVQELLDGVEARQDRQKRRARDDEFGVVLRKPERERPKLVSAEPVKPQPPAEREEVSAYHTLKKKLDRRSEQEAKRRFIYAAMVVLVFWIFLAYLTSEIGWDTMEPWTYFLGIFSVFASYLYFAIRQKEVSPRAIYQQLVESRKQHNYEAFDLEQYRQLVER